VLHSGAIATSAEEAVLVLGVSGAGKSSLALCALRGGWRVLADDLVALVGNGDGELPSELLDDASALPVFARDPRARAELPVDGLTLGCHALAGAIVVDHATSRRGAVESVGGHELLHVLLASWSPIADADDFRAVLPIAAAVARLPAVRVRLGTEANSRVTDGVGLLDQARFRLGLALASTP
jgi:hypothetical protein